MSARQCEQRNRTDWERMGANWHPLPWLDLIEFLMGWSHGKPAIDYIDQGGGGGGCEEPINPLLGHTQLQGRPVAKKKICRFLNEF